MATWKLTRMRWKTQVIYVNNTTGAVHNCGDQHVNTSIKMLVEWVAGEAAPGDFVTLDGETVLVVQRPACG